MLAAKENSLMDGGEGMVTPDVAMAPLHSVTYRIEAAEFRLLAHCSFVTLHTPDAA